MSEENDFLPIEKLMPANRSANVGSQNTIERTLSQAVNLNNEGEMHEPTCNICSSPFRKEAEELFVSNGGKDAEIINLYMTKYNIKISADMVNNHMKFHYNKGIKELQKVEYINRLQRLNNQAPTTLQKLDLGEKVLWERILQLNSITPTGDVSSVEIEKIKSSETAKLMTSLQNLYKLRMSILGEERSNGAMMVLPTKEFVDVFKTTMAECQNKREIEVVNNVLNKLKTLAGNAQ